MNSLANTFIIIITSFANKAWIIIEKRYSELFPSNRGREAKPVRMALGSLLIQKKCGYTDRETVEQIVKAPYLQYFICLREYQNKSPFDPSLMVLFRKRFTVEILKEINGGICQNIMDPVNETQIGRE